MTVENLANLVVYVWGALSVFLYLFCWLNVPVLTLFLFHRLSQIRDPFFDRRPTTPTHTALHLFCAGMYGILLPAFYFLSTRLRSDLGWWDLGRGMNTRWTITLGVLCIAWLTAHWIEAILRMERPRFGRHWADRAVSSVALLLCLRYHVWARGIVSLQRISRREQDLLGYYLQFVAYPQSCFMAVTFVYGLACYESWLGAQRAPAIRRWRRAIPATAVAMALLFAPYLLSLPRVTHRQALGMVEQNRGLIADVARDGQLDPALIAGIIYVAHTRDHPRWTGDVMEAISAKAWMPREEQPLRIDMSVGLCQIRRSTAEQTIGALRNKITLIAPDRWTEILKVLPGQTNSDNFVDPIWENTPSPGLQALTLRIAGLPAGASLDSLLQKPDTNLTLAAMMLVILRDQWEVAGHSIAHKPEILATLYNIGYERSKPHGAPRANDFGRRVAAFMQSKDCRRLLGETE